jgi:hypothetical protein
MRYLHVFTQSPSHCRLFSLFLQLLLTWLLLWSSVQAHATTVQVVDLTLGTSTQGRPITAVQISDGPRKLVLVGNAHGGPERNTFELSTQLAAYFRANPTAVPEDVRLYIIPTLNPDGLALGTRQNVNGVDLNRNMDTRSDPCPENNWHQTAAGAYGIEGDIGGPYAESEVESRLIRDFLLDASGVIFLHTSGAVVFPACDHPPSTALAQVYADATGYQFIPHWEHYLITGGMHDWADGLDIPAITPELTAGDRTDFEQNLAGVLAVLDDAAEELLALPQPQAVGDVEVQPVIWRAWQAWGGAQRFGLPLGPAFQTNDGVAQIFERAVFEYKPAESDTTNVVQLKPLGEELFEPQAEWADISADAAARPEHALTGIFAEFWQRNGGSSMFGIPLGPEEQTTDGTGAPVVRQVFERVVLQRPLNATSLEDVSLEALGRIYWAQVDATVPETSIRTR